MRRLLPVFLLLFISAISGAQLSQSESAAQAASVGDTAQVEALLSDGLDPNDASLALAWAARGGHRAVVEILLDAGADVDDGGPLVQAIAGTHWDVAEVLIDAGADPTARAYPLSLPYPGNIAEGFPYTAMEMYVFESSFASPFSLPDDYPANPVRIAQIDRPYAYAVAVADSRLYLTGQAGTLGVYDVSNPAQPVFLGQSDTPSSGNVADRALSISYEDGVAMVRNPSLQDDSLSTIIVYDVSDPRRPTAVARSTFPIKEAVLRDGVIHTIEDLPVLGIMVARTYGWSNGGLSLQSSRQYINDQESFVASLQSGLVLYDFAESSLELGLDRLGPIIPLHGDRALAVSARSSGSVPTISLFDLETLEVLDTRMTGNEAVASDGKYLYMSESSFSGTSSLVVYETTDDELRVAGYSPSPSFSAAAYSNGYVFAAGWSGVQIFDVSRFSGYRLPSGAIARASSVLPASSSGAFRYEVDQLFDGDPLTAWSEDSAGDGVGESVLVEFPEETTIDAINIRAGFHDERWYLANPRAAQIRVIATARSGEVLMDRDFPLLDVMEPQVVTFPAVTASWIRIEASEVYAAERWDDLSWSELVLLNGSEQVAP